MEKEDIKGRLLGLDFGSKTVGVSVSDPLQLTAKSLCTVRRERENKLRQTLAEIVRIAQEEEVVKIVVGLPLNMDGTEGERCEKTREFVSLLEKRIDVPVVFCDERLTTEEAYEIMEEYGVPKEKQFEMVDSVAAMHILQDYLNGKDKICG